MTRLTIADLTPAERRYVHDEERADRRLSIVLWALAIVGLYVIGGVFIGDPVPVDYIESSPDAPPASATTDPASVAAPDPLAAETSEARSGATNSEVKP